MSFIFFIFLIIVPTYSNCENNLNVVYLEPETAVEHVPRGSMFAGNNLQIYCYRGRAKYLIHLFHTINLKINIKSDDFIQYKGSTPQNVNEDYNNQRSLFSFNFLSGRRKLLKLNPFNQTCIGIDTSQQYKVELNLIQIDFWKILLLSLGISIYFTAHKLSHNSLFYYICGILFGITSSFLIVVYLGSKLFPKRPFMYGVMIGGWTLGIYFAQMIWENIQVILVSYQVYAFWYIIITGLISFLICYRLGPPKNIRSINIIKWSLQTAALIMIFCSSCFQEATVGIIIAIVLLNVFPRKILYKTRSIWLIRFPPKRRLLSLDEYNEQSIIETAKALDNLKNFCNSPECNQWKTVLKLKDPSRFASFINGSSHLNDDEMLDYETSNMYIEDDEVEYSEYEDDDNLPINYNQSHTTFTGKTISVDDNIEISDDE